ncbi:ORC2-domain-containing protein [Amniculicola lignicola CBS 123094]|uniref:Origin recognition complex subunit 2 n=1 Tax=Amniculicola lignicola CBS 123094 TaxID=1392246 RepID=A0A6A5X2H0_9PLEO|nr:ORC2-domain-containing protein [Amniculicola lignicola CBS 123094]
MASAKRKRTEDEVENTTPRKLRAQILVNGEAEDHDAPGVQTPSRRARVLQGVENGTPRSILKKTGLLNGANGTTPKSSRKLEFQTPTKSPKNDTPNGTPTIVRNADRSARRKSNRKLVERTINGDDSDEEALDEEDELAQNILGDIEDEEAGDAVAGPQEEVPVPETPSKRGRGRPKGSGTKGPGRPRKQRLPTPPPQELPAHEEYFWQNRPGGAKTSNNTLSAQTLLNHDEYFQTMQQYEERHEPEMTFLWELHSRAYDQWVFELNEGFNICLYGYGSKRPITEAFIAHLYEHLLENVPYKGTKKTPKIVVVNGYESGITLKEVLMMVASAAVPSNLKLPNQTASLVLFILQYLSENPPQHPVPLIVNSIDSPYLRKSGIPAILASLAAHPSISLVCTADTPNFPLLWDVGLRTQYKFLFHDATTFAPYDAELDVVESVNELLGRSGRRVGGRDGVGFVLRSLPENARSLFRILVTEQLALLIMDGDHGGIGEDEPTATPRNKKILQTKSAVSDSVQGVEYRVLYHKAVEEFVCSSEVGFRTLLKEFHDHQMVESRKDAMGTERLWVPFRLEELEGLAEDLSGDAF